MQPSSLCVTLVTHGLKERISLRRSGVRISRGRGPSALAASKIKVKPLLVVPRLVGGLETVGGRDVERTVSYDEPLVLRLEQHGGTAVLWPLVARLKWAMERRHS